MELEPINQTIAVEMMNGSERYPNVQWMDEEDFIYEVPVGIVLLLALLYGTISLLAVIGNSLVIWIVMTTRTMQTVTNWYIANLAMADVIIGAFAIPFQFHAALLQRWNLPHFMCQFCPFVQCVSVTVSVLTLTAIAIDRHRAILNPLRARQSKYVSRIIIIFIWAVALMLAAPSFYVLTVIENQYVTIRGDDYFYVKFYFCDRINFTEEDMRIYRYVLVVVQFLIPFCVISFVYIQMAVKLWGSKTPGNAQNERDKALLRNKKKVVKMLVIVVVLFGVCWLPLQTYHILEVTWVDINLYRYINIIWFCCDWLAMSNSCYNPFIYGIYNEKFKREFLRRCPFCRFGAEYVPDNETKSMYTRATSIRSNFTNASVRHNNHHVNQSSALPTTTLVNNSYYGCLNHGGGGGGAQNNLNNYTSTKRYSSGDLELKPTASAMKCSSCNPIKDSNRKIVFQPIRTASLKNNLAGSGPMQLRTSHNSNGGVSGGPYPETDLCDAPLLARIGESDNGTTKAGDVKSAGSGGGNGTNGHYCKTGICLNEGCPGIMFEDVDL